MLIIYKLLILKGTITAKGGYYLWPNFLCWWWGGVYAIEEKISKNGWCVCPPARFYPSLKVRLSVRPRLRVMLLV